MRAIIKRINTRLMFHQMLLNRGMDFVNCVLRKKAAANAGLVADHHDLEAGIIQARNGLLHAGNEHNLVDTAEIVFLFDQRTVTVEKEERGTLLFVQIHNHM